VIPLSHVVALIPITPEGILLQLGPISIGWYGIGYVLGLGVMLLVAQSELVRRGYNPNHIWNALILVGALALIGGRLYHVIDQWGAIYSQDPLKAILPPYSGLGLYGGVAGAVLGIFIYTRWKRIPLALGLDVVAAGALFAQGIARWGNFFNQELYGPPTNLPWGIAIDCAHRVSPWFCPPAGIYDINTGFQPLFFYESMLDILGGLVLLYISRRYLARLQPGDLAAAWGIWYGLTRAGLETLRTEWDWKIGGIPTAIIIGVGLALFGAIWIIYNHPRGKDPYPYLPPWTPERERAGQLALAGAAAGGSTLAMPGGPDSDEDADADYEDDDEWEDDDADDAPLVEGVDAEQEAVTEFKADA
jgi:phosphatidylglycerol:prolipoprotein diacylglycerol transferase